MKLERLHNSQYNHDSLGEASFYVRFKKQMSKDVFWYMQPSLINKTTSCSAHT
jgi:hypothetical protein